MEWEMALESTHGSGFDGVGASLEKGRQVLLHAFFSGRINQTDHGTMTECRKPYRTSAT